MVGVVRNVRNMLEEVRSKVWAMTVPLDTNAFNLPDSGNARISDPDPSLALDIDSWA